MRETCTLRRGNLATNFAGRVGGGVHVEIITAVEQIDFVNNRRAGRCLENRSCGLIVVAAYISQADQHITGCTGKAPVNMRSSSAKAGVAQNRKDIICAGIGGKKMPANECLRQPVL